MTGIRITVDRTLDACDGCDRAPRRGIIIGTGESAGLGGPPPQRRLRLCAACSAALRTLLVEAESALEHDEFEG